MKNILFIQKSIIALLVLAIVLTTSCNKRNGSVKLLNNDEVHVTERVPWIPIIAGIVYIVVHITEGQYHHEITYNPDGTIASDNTWCDGFGSCCIKGLYNTAGNLSTYSNISSIDYGDDYDYTGEAQLLKTTDNKILFKITNDSANMVCFNNFFYDNVIKISRPLIIDNREILNSLGRDQYRAIIVQGDYEVYDLDDGKFIVID